MANTFVPNKKSIAMKFFILLSNLLLLNVFSVSAQKKILSVKGQLTDSLQLQQVTDATVSLISAADSSLVAFTRTDSAGHFSFQQLKPGRYRLSASQVNFHPRWKNFELADYLYLGSNHMK
jgi:hypothetical protein